MPQMNYNSPQDKCADISLVINLSKKKKKTDQHIFSLLRSIYIDASIIHAK